GRRHVEARRFHRAGELRPHEGIVRQAGPRVPRGDARKPGRISDDLRVPGKVRALLALLLLVAQAHAASVKIPDAWRACKKTSECKAASADCGYCCDTEAINEKSF